MRRSIKALIRMPLKTHGAARGKSGVMRGQPSPAARLIFRCNCRRRMSRGHWIPGTDHAGIATQLIVERQLEVQQLTRRALGREGFIKRVWAWKKASGSTIT